MVVLHAFLERRINVCLEQCSQQRVVVVVVGGNEYKNPQRSVSCFFQFCSILLVVVARLMDGPKQRTGVARRWENEPDVTTNPSYSIKYQWGLTFGTIPIRMGCSTLVKKKKTSPHWWCGSSFTFHIHSQLASETITFRRIVNNANTYVGPTIWVGTDHTFCSQRSGGGTGVGRVHRPASSRYDTVQDNPQHSSRCTQWDVPGTHRLIV